MLSKTFSITNGNQQGCPLSPPIFNLFIEPLTKTIWSNPDISEFTFRAWQDKINLLSYDVIIMLTKPATYLKVSQNALTIFSDISYYKVNSTKSYAFNMGINPSLKQWLQAEFSYVWNDTGISYFVFTPTNTASTSVVLNYTKLLEKFSIEISWLAKYEFFWFGHLAAFKVILSKFCKFSEHFLYLSVHPTILHYSQWPGSLFCVMVECDVPTLTWSVIK